MKNEDKILLNEVFKKYPAIHAVYLFGSAASGKIHQESDLDLAIITNDPSLSEKKLDILTDLAHVGFSDVDLVFPDDSDLVLLYETIRENILIYHIPEFDRGSTYSKVVRQYLDFYPYLTVQRQAYKRRILNGSIRSGSQTIK